MTATEVWRLDAERAHLTLGPLSATVDTSRPGLGLFDLRSHNTSLSAARLLAVQFVGQQASATQVVADHFIRGRDLVVTYVPAHERPVRLQIYWRALNEIEMPGCVVGVDVQVSVQTNLLHAWPTLLMQSQLPCSTILPLTTAASVSSLASDGETRASARCWLCRFGSVGTTYAEMVHPADVEREEISHATDVAKISRELFGHSLEKGVILRARARGIFMPTDGDEAIASTAYDEFLAAPPPLTT